MGQAHTVVFDFIDRLSEVTSSDDAWQSFMAFIGDYGFHRAAVIDLPTPDTTFPDNLVALTWPEDWGHVYVQGNYLWRDPPVRGIAHSREPFTWAESLTFEDYSRADRNIVFEAGDFGLHSGLVIPIMGLRTKSVMSMAGDDSRLTARDRAQLHFAGMYAQARVRALKPKKAKPRAPLVAPRLSDRERECLQWAAMGKSDWEIGEILTIGARTVGTHIERAREKLGVATRIQAVVIALQNGAIAV